MDQRGQRADRGDPSDHVIGKDGRGVVEPVPGAGVVRLRVRVCPELADARGGAHQRAVPQPVAPRPAVAEGTAFGQHHARIQRLQGFVRKAKCGKSSRLEVGEHRVGVGDQSAEHLLAGGAAQVEAERQVVAMRPRERLAHGFADAGLSQSVRVGRALDLDHLGAQIAEQPAEFAAGDDDAEVDDAQPVERARPGFCGRRYRRQPRRSIAHRGRPASGAGVRKPMCWPLTE